MRALRTSLLVITCCASFASGAEPPAPRESLNDAARRGAVDALRQLIDGGADVNAKDTYGSTPLIVAATFGKTEAARTLVKAGADLEATNKDGSAPLQVAAFLCHTDVVKLLLGAGADKRPRNNFSNTALDSVVGPFEDVQGIYAALGQALGPFGLTLDAEHLKATRPKIAQLLRATPRELGKVEYAPLERDDWKVSTPAKQGLDPHLVAELYYDAAALPKAQSVLIIKNGYLVAERYFNGAAVDQATRVQSVTKSFTSALTGIALDNGKLSSVDQKMCDFFPEVADKITDPRKKQITIRHLLQMRAGYPWEETDPNLWQGLLSGQYPPLIAEFPLIAAPGEQFNYSNLSSNWLGIIVARAVGTNLKAYAQEHLFAPLNVTPGEWGTDADGNNNGCADLYLTPRSMARFGLLYLKGGRLDGRQIVPARWVADSLKNYSPDAWITKEKSHIVGPYFRDLGYGYQWWSATVGTERLPFAWGHGGQLIILFPQRDMVIVTTSYPFYVQHDTESWRHEKAIINVVGKFIRFLPPP